MNIKQAHEIKTLFEEIVELDGVVSIADNSEDRGRLAIISKRLKEIAERPFGRPHTNKAAAIILEKHLALVVEDLKVLRNDLDEQLKKY